MNSRQVVGLSYIKIGDGRLLLLIMDKYTSLVNQLQESLMVNQSFFYEIEIIF
jgi:hypothetical protein